MTKKEYTDKLYKIYGNKYTLITDKEDYYNRDCVDILCNKCGTIKHNVTVRHSIRNGNLTCDVCHDQEFANKLIIQLNNLNPNEWHNVKYSHGKYTAIHKCGGIKESSHISDFINGKLCNRCGKGSVVKKIFAEIVKTNQKYKYNLNGRILNVTCPYGHTYDVDIYNYYQSKNKCKICSKHATTTFESYCAEFAKKKESCLYKLIRLEDYNNIKNRILVFLFLPYDNITEFKFNKNDVLNNRIKIQNSYDMFISSKDALEKELNCKVLTSFKEWYNSKSKEFKNSKIKIKDSNNKIYVISYNKELGMWCKYKKSKISNGMISIMESLNAEHVYFKKEVNKKIYNHNVRYDIFIEKINLFIEYDGRQHFIPTKYFDQNYNLKYRVNMDILKNIYCLKNNINILRIPYSLKHSEIKNIIFDMLRYNILYVVKKYKSVYAIINGIEYNKESYYVRVKEIIDNDLTETLLNCSGNSLESELLKG